MTDELHPRFATIEWDPSGAPYSPRYRDIYYSRAGGLGEAQHVFLAGNDLPERWRGRAEFAIAETGFGTGLNLLLTLRSWCAICQPGQRLIFISVDHAPLAPADLERAAGAWPELAQWTPPLVAAYRRILEEAAAVDGSARRGPTAPAHRVTLEALGVELVLLLTDLERALSLIADAAPRGIDAWYLHGFAPSRNPEMWTPSLFRCMRDCTPAGGTFATFTCAGAIRRGLAECGFEVEKVPGHETKREMLRGRRLRHTTT